MAVAIPVPPSPVSTSSAISGSPPALDPSTLALLDSFIAEKNEEERRFNELAEQAAARIARLALGFDDDESGEEPEQIMSVDEYRVAFAEDWQLSQFWYTTPFAMRLARALHALCAPTTSIAFVCCPTAFVAFQHTRPLRNARLLELDGRFAVLAPRAYVPYDMEAPTVLPAYMSANVDIAVVDPPFLNERTNRNIVATLRQIMRPAGKLVVITSTSVSDVLERLYDAAPLGPLRRTKVDVLHGRLQNDFACWGSWDGADEFGVEKGDTAGDADN
ncbi:putative N6-adenine methyltransferase-domain-containing protein [Mycena belliarum]|uniref:N6-adenine methyltransferase-domain-containing protein n=1 Tax=Mycena belliarum TaxID=1033014 RepID=A0AAD6XLT5_9AGAR|nr:putative N6-adenine methyltransferase-domain-containing protein [Mycena belliae]